MGSNLLVPAIAAAAFYLGERRKTKRMGKALLGAGLGLALTVYGPRYGIRVG